MTKFYGLSLTGNHSLFSGSRQILCKTLYKSRDLAIAAEDEWKMRIIIETANDLNCMEPNSVRVKVLEFECDLGDNDYAICLKLELEHEDS